MSRESKLWTNKYISFTFKTISRDSVVDIATCYGVDDLGVVVRVPVGSRIFSSPCLPDRLWGRPNLLSNGYWGIISPGVKRPELEADHSPPTSAEVKKIWIYAPTPPYAVMTWCLVKHRDFIFYLSFLGSCETVDLVRRQLIGLLYQSRIIVDGEHGAGGAMRKRAPMPLCPPQIPHDRICVRIRTAAVRS
jgi:hypothetical protein